MNSSTDIEAGRPSPWMTGLRDMRFARQAFIVCLSVVILALIGIGTSAMIRARMAEANTAVQAKVSRDALLVEEQLRRQLLLSDQTLRVLEVAWQRDPGHFKLDDWAGQLVAVDDTVLQIFVADASGQVTQSTRPEIVGQNVSYREYFRHEAALRHDDGAMFINEPVLGQVTQRWQFNLVRRLDLPDGSFGGVVAITIVTAALDAFSNVLDIGSRGVVALVSRSQGTMLARGGISQAEAFKPIVNSPLLDGILVHSEGVWTGPTPTDGIERIHAFASIPDRMLTLVVGVERTEAMLGFVAWRRDALVAAAALAMVVLLVCGVLLRVSRAATLREQALARDRADLTAANQALVEARAQSQANTARLEGALASMTDGIMMVDDKLCLLEWNEKFPAFTGVPAEMLRVGLPMREMLRAQVEAGEFGPVDPDAEVRRRMAILENAETIVATERVRPNGQVLEIRRNKLPSGGYVTLYTDATERHVAAERVRQAQTMAAVGRLTAGVAHDFNNLLASVTLNAEMLEIDLAFDPKLARRAGIVLQAANRGAALVAQLLAFSRKQELLPALVDINATVTAMSGIIRTSVGSSIQFEIDLCPNLWLTLIDPVQIEHVVLNLVINSRDAMPNGGTLTITTNNETLPVSDDPAALPKGDYVMVCVSDTGIGMTEEVRRNAFDPFFTTKAAGKGSGLGLSQVYGVTSQSGGAATIESAPGQGTKIRLFLPRAEAMVG